MRTCDLVRIWIAPARKKRGKSEKDSRRRGVPLRLEKMRPALFQKSMEPIDPSVVRSVGSEKQEDKQVRSIFPPLPIPPIRVFPAYLRLVFFAYFIYNELKLFDPVRRFSRNSDSRKESST